VTERLPTLIIVQTILAIALSAPAAAQQNTWPSGRAVEGFAERVVQTDTVELGHYDCTPASALMAVRTLGVPFPEADASDAVAYIREEAEWPLDGIGMSLMQVGSVLQRNGVGVEYVRDADLVEIGRGINRGGIGILCGRNVQQDLHTIAVVDYNLDTQRWLIHDPDRDRPGWVTTGDLTRFRENRCEDKVDLLVQEAGQRPLLPKASLSLRELVEQLEDEELEREARRARRREERGEQKAGKRKRKKPPEDGAEKQGKKAGKSGKSAGKSRESAGKSAGKAAGNSGKSAGKAGKSRGKAKSKTGGKRRANNAVATTGAESESSMPGGSIGLGLAILAGLLVVLGGAIFGVRRGWFERYDLDDE